MAVRAVRMASQAHLSQPGRVQAGSAEQTEMKKEKKIDALTACQSRGPGEGCPDHPRGIRPHHPKVVATYVNFRCWSCHLACARAGVALL